MDKQFRIAKKESEKSTQKFQLGCVIVRKGKIIAKAYNTTKTCPSFGIGAYSTLHAEARAIKRCIRTGKSLKGASIWIYRKGNRLSKPCKCCAVLLEAVGIKEVHYTDGEYKNITL